MSQVSDYEFKKPTFEYHKALILQILHNDPEAKTSFGLTDEQILPKLVNRLRKERLERKEVCEGRKIPTVDNRLRDLASDNSVVRIKGFDGLKHNFHPLVFTDLPLDKLKQHFPESEIDEWRKRILQEDVTLETMTKKRMEAS